MLKHKTEIKNNRSLIDHKYVTSEGTSIIGIYAHNNSRTIYIETGHNDERVITKYQIQFSASRYASDAASSWKSSNVDLSMQTVSEISSLRESSQTTKEFQVTNKDMQLFKSVMDDALKETSIVNGDQDHNVKKALLQIGESIEFHRSSESSVGCVIS